MTTLDEAALVKLAKSWAGKPSLGAASAMSIQLADGVLVLLDERNEARYHAIILGHAYQTDTRPPARTLSVVSTYPRHAEDER